MHAVSTIWWPVSGRPKSVVVISFPKRQHWLPFLTRLNDKNTAPSLPVSHTSSAFFFPLLVFPSFCTDFLFLCRDLSVFWVLYIHVKEPVNVCGIHAVQYNYTISISIKITFSKNQTNVGMAEWIYWLTKSSNKRLYHWLTKHTNNECAMTLHNMATFYIPNHCIPRLAFAAQLAKILMCKR